jgi:hypothetical protein
MIYCHNNSRLFIRYVQGAMIVQIEGQRGIRDQLCVPRQSRTFNQGTDHETETVYLPHSAMRKSPT